MERTLLHPSLVLSVKTYQPRMMSTFTWTLKHLILTPLFSMLIARDLKAVKESLLGQDSAKKTNLPDLHGLDHSKEGFEIYNTPPNAKLRGRIQQRSEVGNLR